jgi:hypothetical protein
MLLSEKFRPTSQLIHYAIRLKKKETPLSNSEGEMINNLRFGPVNQENQFESQGQMQDFILINLL